LSYAARGLLWECLTHNEDKYTIHRCSMIGNGRDKRASVTQAWRELEAYGYAMSYSPTKSNRNMIYMVAEHPRLLADYLKNNPDIGKMFYEQATSRKWLYNGRRVPFKFMVDPISSNGHDGEGFCPF